MVAQTRPNDNDGVCCGLIGSTCMFLQTPSKYLKYGVSSKDADQEFIFEYWYHRQGFAWSWYLSQTCNLQAEFVCLDWADKM